jgi:hypothetical protein
MHLSSTAELLNLALLVTSAVVLVYLVSYTTVLLWQVRRKEARPDWRISLVFYGGILVLAVGNLIGHAAELWHASNYGLASALYLVATVFFIVGFHQRSLKSRLYTRGARGR